MLCIGLLVLFACRNDPDVQKDTEANAYYANYLTIYNNYKNVPFQQTNDSLEAYLETYPQMPQAWLLYSYVNYKLGDLTTAKNACFKALERDTTGTKAYQYLSAYYLQDADSCQLALKYANMGLAKNDSSIYLLNNLSYYYLLCPQNGVNPDLEKANFLNKKALSINAENHVLFRTASVIAHLKTNVNERETYYQLAKQHQLKDTASLRAFFNEEISLLSLYKSYE